MIFFKYIDFFSNIREPINWNLRLLA
jgi:hypothetical protein